MNVPDLLLDLTEKFVRRFLSGGFCPAGFVRRVLSGGFCLVCFVRFKCDVVLGSVHTDSDFSNNLKPGTKQKECVENDVT